MPPQPNMQQLMKQAQQMQQQLMAAQAELAETEVEGSAGGGLVSARMTGSGELLSLTIDPKAAGFAAVIAGHSHRPAVTEQDGVLFVNPGSAGPRRFTLPVATARLRVAQGAVSGEIVLLDV